MRRRIAGGTDDSCTYGQHRGRPVVAERGARGVDRRVAPADERRGDEQLRAILQALHLARERSSRPTSR